MKRFSEIIRLDPDFKSVAELLREQIASPSRLPILINGLTGGAVDACVAELAYETKEAGGAPCLLLVRDGGEAVRTVAALSSLGVRALYYPMRDFCYTEMTASHDMERERLAVLYAAASHAVDIIVATAGAVLQPTMPKETLLSLAVSPASLPPAELCRRFVALGYAAVPTVESIGQFSSRGGIVDVYPTSSPSPVRLDYFGDELDRMTYFDPTTQRSNGEAEPFVLLPSREVLLTEEGRGRLADLIRRQMKGKEGIVLESLARDLAAVTGETDPATLDKYIGDIYPEPATLLSYLGESTPVFLLGTNEVREGYTAAAERINDTIRTLTEEGRLHPGVLGIAPFAHLEQTLAAHPSLHINSFSGGVGNLRASGLFGFRCRRTVSYADRREFLLEEIAVHVKEGYRILLLAGSDAEGDSLEEVLRAAEITVLRLSREEPLSDANFLRGVVAISSGYTTSGFALPSARAVVFTTAPDDRVREGETRRLRRRGRKEIPAGKRLLSYAELSPGDYVVHATHGIGIFDGIETIVRDGAARDYITIRYAGVDKLFLPAERLELISKYIGAKSEDGTVKLSRLGGTEWQKQTKRAKAAAREMAHELIALYAARSRLPGTSLTGDPELESQFASAFPFELTDSQEAAVREILADMERPTPMDRLLCGDVGYGKTEVALRAAFRAILSGRQVAILVPTTILALQHYETALSRLRSFPCNIEMLSRFRTPREEAAILRRLARGEIDLIIGTHKLLSPKVEFRDLGLLVVDEEQRFGVSQKEKLKRFATGIDCLTLTATPIPRTLNMAMSGIRDMSILDEAPGDRTPVETYVLAHDDFVIAEAMRRELARGGQVLYLYNKVEDIDLVAGKVLRALPEANVAFAHGQMSHDDLEDIWQALVRGEIDVLVCTTIIETGVDLPNANTLIIENADRLGLSQLHQIRGRVGRSARHAFAYFTYRPGKSLSEIATKRLSAIREYAEFGAGFRIALRDLEIRGAGNLLGAEQHGHIDAVGYDLYIRLLNEAILEEQGKTVEVPFESVVDFSLSANIPTSYITRSAHRMEMYKKISLILTEEDLSDVGEEFRDRFGKPPIEVERLLRLSLVRALASRARIGRVEFRGAESKPGVLAERPELRFFGGESDISVWACVFGDVPRLRFGGVHRSAKEGAGVPGVTLRLTQGEEATERALTILTAYEKHRLALAEKKES